MAMPDPAQEKHQLLRKDALAAAARGTFSRIRNDQKRASKKLRPLLRYIEANLFSPSLNVHRLKQACRIRDNSVTIKFHSEIGQPPKTYISSRRLETAARLLTQTNLLVWKIAELVGYSGLGVFSKAFNRWAGQRPNAFRRQMREVDQSEVPSGLVSPSFLRRAVAGELSTEDAKWLVAKLLEVYPEAQETNGAVPNTEGQERDECELCDSERSPAAILSEI